MKEKPFIRVGKKILHLTGEENGKSNTRSYFPKLQKFQDTARCSFADLQDIDARGDAEMDLKNVNVH